jgi:hypothetical protein
VCRTTGTLPEKSDADDPERQFAAKGHGFGLISAENDAEAEKILAIRYDHEDSFGFCGDAASLRGQLSDGSGRIGAT